MTCFHQEVRLQFTSILVFRILAGRKKELFVLLLLVTVREVCIRP